MYIIKYGLIFFTNRYREDILVFNDLNKLRAFMNIVEKKQLDDKEKKIMDTMIQSSERYQTMDFKRSRDLFDEQLIEQIIVGNCIFDVIVVEGTHILILNRVADPFINEYA